MLPVLGAQFCCSGASPFCQRAPVALLGIGSQPVFGDGTAMEILDRFDGLHGKITVVQERTTGARLYLEEGIKQSYVLPGGSAGLDYVRLMGRLLQNASDIALFGCGCGECATGLYRYRCRLLVGAHKS